MYIFVSTSSREDSLKLRDTVESIGDTVTNRDMDTPPGSRLIIEQEEDLRAAEEFLFERGSEILLGMALGLGKRVCVIGKLSFYHPKIRYYESLVHYIKGIEKDA